jgi:hypothetical protein
MTFATRFNTDKVSSIERTPELEKLNSFRNLHAGWHYGSGGPISSSVIDNAISVYNLFRLVGFTRNNFFAGENGEILATAYRRDHYVGVTIEPSGSNTITYEVGNKDVMYLEDLDLKSIKKAIIDVAGTIWNMSASSILASTITIAANSMTWSLKTLQEEDYLPSRYHAQKIPA